MEPDDLTTPEPMPAPAAGRPRGGRAVKREAILRGALSVLVREGFSGAPVSTNPPEPAVSTRTIYNHFADQEDLFHAVVERSSRRVAEAEIALVDQHLHGGEDPERELIAFARAWLTPAETLAEHHALVRRLGVDRARVPDAALDAWREEGPLRVRRALAEKLATWVEAGVLERCDPVHAAVHLSLLISAAVPGQVSGARTPEEAELWIGSGIRAFLHGYARA